MLLRRLLPPRCRNHWQSSPHIARYLDSRPRDNITVMRASIANTAPVRNVAVGPEASHIALAMMLAARSATPVTRLNIPNAVPLGSGGAVSATRVDSRP